MLRIGQNPALRYPDHRNVRNKTNDAHHQPASRALIGPDTSVRVDYLQSALKVIDDRNILINVVSQRVKQLRRGSRPLVESLEKLATEDIALREIAEGKIGYELPTAEELAHRHGGPAADSEYSQRAASHWSARVA